MRRGTNAAAREASTASEREGAQAPCDSIRAPGDPALLELLEQGDDGRPRRLRRVLPPGRLESDIRRAAADARARGFVPISVRTYAGMRGSTLESLRDRSLLLIARPGDAETAATALLNAAARSPRAHVLLQFAAPGGGPLLVREARARYGAGGAALRSGLPAGPDVQRERTRVAHGCELAATGRRAAGMRLLREAAAALARRGRADDAAVALIALGRLLLERGRPTDADRTFEQAAEAALHATHHDELLRARLGQASARIDAGRLTDAEAICRAVLLSDHLSPSRGAEAVATLVRVLLCQDRLREAAALDATLPPAGGADLAVRAYAGGTRVRLLVRLGHLFAAGLETQTLLATASAAPALDRTGEARLARIVALTAAIRVAVAAGDLPRATEQLSDLECLCRQAGTPLRAARARLLVIEGLLRGGQLAAARHAARRLRRLGRAAPPLLRRALTRMEEQLQRGAVDGPATVAPPLDAARLVVLAHETEDDEEALRQVLRETLESLCATRVDLWAAEESAPASVLVHVGAGAPTVLGTRVLEAGLALGPEAVAGGEELGVAVRRGPRLAGAIVARWAADRSRMADAPAVLTIAAAAIGPRLDGLQAGRRLARQASTEIPELVGVSHVMQEVRAAIARAAGAPFAVLLLGESGVGKELAARAIHHLSVRRARPFSDINCAAVPDELLEAELFGHARGAFTGAVVERPGLLEAASGGTVFLDEIADLSPRGQAKLLRALQQQEVRRIGESFSRAIDVRLVAAANRDLHAEVAAGRFRADLLYRLDVIRVRIPPLRERPDDVAPLAQHFWAEAARRVGTRASLTHGVFAALARYHWPGNVRELQNVMAALAVAAPAMGPVRTHLLPAAIAGATVVTASRLADARAQFERRTIESALARAGGNRSRTARELGLSRQGLLKMMGRLGITGRSSGAA
jgi:DNA-binding NtrC family response regulator